MRKLFVVLLSSLSLIACHKDSKAISETITDRTTVPGLNASMVSTIVSDSGITRYRISTNSWQIYDKAIPVYWEFPEGLYLEKFDENLHVDTWLKSTYAWYNQDEEMWILTGKVESMNVDSEFFETTHLEWKQRDQLIRSDSAIRITKATSIIEGIGFESNQTMTKYTILNPTGVFPIKD